MTHGEIYTKAGKRKFIRDLCKTVEATALAAVSKMPMEWDGHELREMLACMFDEQRSHIMRGSGNQRRRNYDNERIVRNLP